MGQAQSGSKGGPVVIDEADLAARYKLSPEQIGTLVRAFKSKAPKGTVDKKQFVTIVSEVKIRTPELAVFDDEVIGLIFTFADVDHSGKLDPFEVIAALGAFASGDMNEKAKLVFKSIDRDHSKVLTKDELRKHARLILSFSSELVKRDIKTAVKGALGSFAAKAMGASLNTMQKQFVEDIVRDVLVHDTNNDGYLSEEEWTEAAKTSNTVKAMIDPNLSANAWRTIFALEESDDANRKLQEVMSSPKGFACIFDMQAEGGKYQALGSAPSSPKPPPPDKKITIVGSKSGGTPHVISQSSTYASLLDKAVSETDIPRDRIALKSEKEGATLGDQRFLDLEIYDDVQNGDTLTVVDRENWSGDIKVKTLTGKTIVIPMVSHKVTVLQLKEKVQDKEGIPPATQRLIYKGRQLDDDSKQLCDYNIVDGASIHLILRLGGN